MSLNIRRFFKVRAKFAIENLFIKNSLHDRESNYGKIAINQAAKNTNNISNVINIIK